MTIRIAALLAAVCMVALSSSGCDRESATASPVPQIVTDPTLLLCDEPTGDLDRKSGDEILSLLQALNREHGKTIVMVTHDPHASARATRTVLSGQRPALHAKRRHEIPRPRLEQSEAQEAAHHR